MTVTTFEVEQDHLVDVDEFDQLVQEGSAQPLHVRDLLVELKALEVKTEEVQELKAAVVERYDVKLEALGAHRQRIRDSIEGFIVNLNCERPVAIPDAGTAYLTTKKAKIEVEDTDAFDGWAREAGFTEVVVKATEAKQAALKRATDTGELVPGIEFVPPSKTLAIRLV